MAHGLAIATSILQIRFPRPKVSFVSKDRARELTRLVDEIDRRGVMLVYPQKGHDDPTSIWHVLYPRRTMQWAWDEDADPRVAQVWHLREELARDPRVVYGKWFAGRATFFSKELFLAMLTHLREAAKGDLRVGLSLDAQGLLSALEDDSPMATRALREATDLAGRVREGAYTRAMRVLWSRLLVVGAGEVAEGGFPSLAIGATSLLLEDLWNRSAAPKSTKKKAKSSARNEGEELLVRTMESSPAFARAFRRVVREVAAAAAER